MVLFIGGEIVGLIVGLIIGSLITASWVKERK